MVSYVRNRDFLSLIFGQLLYYISHKFAWAIFPIYLLFNGFETIDLAWFYLITFVTVLIIQTAVRTSGMRRIVTRSLFLRVVMVLLILKLVYAWQLWAVAVIYGVFWSFFWVVFNIRYYQLTTEGGTAFASAIASSMGPLAGVLVPFLTGIIAGSIGHSASLIISIPFILASWLSFRKLPPQKATYDLPRALASMQNLKRLLFIDGFWQTSYYLLIPVITLYFLDNVIQYGAFLSYLGIVGVLSSFVLSRLADKYKNRSIFIYPATIFLSAFTIVAAFTDTWWSWSIIVGILSFFRGMSNPLMTTVVIDTKKDLHDAMLGREYLLNVGRVAGIICSIILYYLFHDFRYALFMVGIVASFYPVVLFSTKVYEQVDKRMRYMAKDRFTVMVRLFLVSPLVFFPKHIRKHWPSVAQFWSELKINRIMRR